jgi:hypothetical protein
MDSGQHARKPNSRKTFPALYDNTAGHLHNKTTETIWKFETRARSASWCPVLKLLNHGVRKAGPQNPSSFSHASLVADHACHTFRYDRIVAIVGYIYHSKKFVNTEV